MGTFLLILIVCFVVIPLFRAWLAVHRLRNQARESFRQANAEAERHRRERRPGGWSRSRNTQSNKKYAPSDGEYVEWEELKVESSSTTFSSDPNGQTTIETESQVADVEWEEIRTKE